MAHAAKKRTVFFILLAVLTLAVVYLVMLWRYDAAIVNYGRKAAYLSTRGYARVLGVRQFDEAAFLDEYGAPEHQYRWEDANDAGRMLIRDEYSTFEVLYAYRIENPRDTDPVLVLVIFQDDALRFGKQRVGVGSTREEVRLAYANDPQVDAEELAHSALDYPGADEGFYGEDWSRILFCYDDEGTVESMAFEPPAF